MKKLTLSLIFSTVLFGQAGTRKVVLTWTDTLNPAGTTYSVYRATGLCSGTPTFSKISTGITVKTYEDSTVTPGNYCYQVTATLNSMESAPSNSVSAAVTPYPPVLNVQVP